ncbi:MAG TPA: hypothetical protein VGM86_04165 [Thermoanaerobaculia bacterium]
MHFCPVQAAASSMLTGVALVMLSLTGQRASTSSRSFASWSGVAFGAPACRDTARLFGTNERRR